MNSRIECGGKEEEPRRMRKKYVEEADDEANKTICVKTKRQGRERAMQGWSKAKRDGL